MKQEADINAVYNIAYKLLDAMDEELKVQIMQMSGMENLVNV